MAKVDPRGSEAIRAALPEFLTVGSRCGGRCVRRAGPPSSIHLAPVLQLLFDEQGFANMTKAFLRRRLLQSFFGLLAAIIK